MSVYQVRRLLPPWARPPCGRRLIGGDRRRPSPTIGPEGRLLRGGPLHPARGCSRPACSRPSGPPHKGSAALPGGARAVAYPARLFAPLPSFRAGAPAPALVRSGAGRPLRIARPYPPGAAARPVCGLSPSVALAPAVCLWARPRAAAGFLLGRPCFPRAWPLCSAAVAGSPLGRPSGAACFAPGRGRAAVAAFFRLAPGPFMLGCFAPCAAGLDKSSPVWYHGRARLFAGA